MPWPQIAQETDVLLNFLKLLKFVPKSFRALNQALPTRLPSKPYGKWLLNASFFCLPISRVTPSGSFDLFSSGLGGRKIDQEKEHALIFEIARHYTTEAKTRNLAAQLLRCLKFFQSKTGCQANNPRELETDGLRGACRVDEKKPSWQLTVTRSDGIHHPWRCWSLSRSLALW